MSYQVAIFTVLDFYDSLHMKMGESVCVCVGGGGGGEDYPGYKKKINDS